MHTAPDRVFFCSFQGFVSGAFYAFENLEDSEQPGFQSTRFAQNCARSQEAALVVRPSIAQVTGN